MRIKILYAFNFFSDWNSCRIYIFWINLTHSFYLLNKYIECLPCTRQLGIPNRLNEGTSTFNGMCIQTGMHLSIMVTICNTHCLWASCVFSNLRSTWVPTLEPCSRTTSVTVVVCMCFPIFKIILSAFKNKIVPVEHLQLYCHTVQSLHFSRLMRHHITFFDVPQHCEVKEVRVHCEQDIELAV